MLVAIGALSERNQSKSSKLPSPLNQSFPVLAGANSRGTANGSTINLMKFQQKFDRILFCLLELTYCAMFYLSLIFISNVDVLLEFA